MTTARAGSRGRRARHVSPEMTVPANTVIPCSKNSWSSRSILRPCSGRPGLGSYARGAEYARQRAVLDSSWDLEETALRGLVRGHGSRVYSAAAFFSLAGGSRAEFELGECSCPVGFNCKHVVALVLSALAPGSPAAGRPQSASRRPGSGRWTRCWARADPGGPARPRWRSSSRWPAARSTPAGAAARAGAAAADRAAGPAGQERPLGRRRPELGPAGGGAVLR